MVNLDGNERGGITRRDAMRVTLLGSSVLVFPSLLAACGGGEAQTATSDPSATGGSSDWMQFKGTTLSFISENTAESSALAADAAAFTQKTGITINIQQMELGALVQKVALDFGSGRSAYDIIYADPYQVLAPYYEGLVDLNVFMQDKSLPPVPGGVQDFIPSQLLTDGRFLDESKLYALPYDCPTMIWFYRKDIFAKFKDQMSQALGFDPTPSNDTTWDQYYQIAKWFNDNADKTGIPYGTGHQAKQYDSLMCDFSNILASYGGGYFADDAKVGGIGSKNPGACTLDQPEAIQAAEFYTKLLSIANPASTTWDWSGADSGFQTGQMAMVPNWHLFAAGDVAKFGDKVGFSRLPRGPKRSASIYGGTGIAINASASEKQQKAAWLFLVWATSPESQIADLKSKVGGGTPTRTSVYEMPEVLKNSKWPSTMPNLLAADAVREAWKLENVYMRPKIPQWNQVDTVVFTELSKMLAGQQSPGGAMTSAKQQIDKIVGA
jgi:multiple sugar transport system substrate-binding protein